MIKKKGEEDFFSIDVIKLEIEQTSDMFLVQLLDIWTQLCFLGVNFSKFGRNTPLLFLGLIFPSCGKFDNFGQRFPFFEYKICKIGPRISKV